MCVVSAISDDWSRNNWPNIAPRVQPFGPIPTVSPKEFEALKKEVEELKDLLKEARKQDIAEEAPVCAHKESVTLIKELARILDVDLEDVFDGHEPG